MAKFLIEGKNIDIELMKKQLKYVYGGSKFVIDYVMTITYDQIDFLINAITKECVKWKS